MCYMYNGILSCLKKGGHPFICNNMDEPGGNKLSEIIETKKGKCISFICGIKNK